MFLGEYAHSLDEKGRIIFPVKFRAALADGAVLAKALDGCLAVYPKEEFMRIAGEVREQAKRGAAERDAMRAFFSGATEFAPDSQGRVAIPVSLREYAHLGKDVTVIGSGDWVEIWDRDTYEPRSDAGDTSLRSAEAGADFAR